MITGIYENSKMQELHHKQMLNGLNSFDKDGKTGLSLEELKDYKFDKDFGKQEIPEFAQKLIEKFEQLDQDKDGQLQKNEISALNNNRGMWQVHQLPALAQTATEAPPTSNKKENALQNLLKAGYEQLKDKVDIKEVIDKII